MEKHDYNVVYYIQLNCQVRRVLKSIFIYKLLMVSLLSCKRTLLKPIVFSNKYNSEHNGMRQVRPWAHLTGSIWPLNSQAEFVSQAGENCKENCYWRMGNNPFLPNQTPPRDSAGFWFGFEFSDGLDHLFASSNATFSIDTIMYIPAPYSKHAVICSLTNDQIMLKFRAEP